MRFRVEVLGCKVNQYEAEQIKELLAQAGDEAREGEADLLVIHSCAVTAEAIRKLRQTVRRAAAANPQATIFVSGCAARSGLLDAELPAFKYIEPGEGWLARLASSLSEYADLRFEPDDYSEDMLPLRRFSGHHRAFLKIQDGCDIGCSYCIVPSLRGRSRDKPLADILSEARGLVAAGHREIVVTGVSVGLYGKRSGVSLATVMEGLSQIAGLARLRLSSLHPSELNEELLDVWGRSRNMMPHIHLPLQSGDDRVLLRMKRNHNVEEYRRIVTKIRRTLPSATLFTDLIVGFAGETVEQFEHTRSAMREFQYNMAFIAMYSPRPGAVSARWKDDVPHEEKKRRLHELSSELQEMSLDHNQRLVGTELITLVEGYDRKAGYLSARTEGKLIVRFESDDPGLIGQFVTVRIDAAAPLSMEGSFVRLETPAHQQLSATRNR